MTRNERQSSFVEKFQLNKGVGTLLAATGFGKTFCSLLILKKMLEKNSKLTSLIVVPTTNLKLQWEYKINQYKFTGCKVMVVNSACKETSYYDIIILDEVHLYGGEIFSKVFNIPRTYILGLTATLEEDSEIDKLVKKHCPVIDKVSMEECRKNGWVADYEVYNLEVPLTTKESLAFKKAEYAYRKCERDLGGKFEAFDTAKEWKETGTLEQKAIAFLFWRAMQNRRRILINAENKVNYAVEIIKKYPDKKSLVFSEGINVATKVKNALGKTCAVYHSKLTPHEAKRVLKEFKEGNSLTCISSVRALNAGEDIPECSLGIITSGNSKEIDDIQRTGRLVRKLGDKKSIIINLYIKETQDEKWLKKRQKLVIPKIITSLEELPQY